MKEMENVHHCLEEERRDNRAERNRHYVEYLGHCKSIASNYITSSRQEGSNVWLFCCLKNATISLILCFIFLMASFHFDIGFASI
jgi:hypothetical protein